MLTNSQFNWKEKRIEDGQWRVPVAVCERFRSDQVLQLLILLDYSHNNNIKNEKNELISCHVVIPNRNTIFFMQVSIFQWQSGVQSGSATTINLSADYSFAVLFGWTALIWIEFQIDFKLNLMMWCTVFRIWRVVAYSVSRRRGCVNCGCRTPRTQNLDN